MFSQIDQSENRFFSLIFAEGSNILQFSQFWPRILVVVLCVCALWCQNKNIYYPQFLENTHKALAISGRLPPKRPKTTLKASWGREELCLIFMKLTNVSLLWLKGYFKLKISPLTDFRVHGIYFALVVIEERSFHISIWAEVTGKYYTHNLCSMCGYSKLQCVISGDTFEM